MKTKIAALIVLFLITIGVSAQIDRSKQPQPGPAPKIVLEVPGEFQLKNGLKVLVVENHKLPRVSYSLTIDNKPVSSGEKAGVEILLGSMLGNGTTSIPKDEFNDEVDFLGATLDYSSSGGFASSLSKYSDRILELMADAAIHPLLKEDEFNKEKTKLIENLKSQEKSVDAVASRVSGALSYGTHHPYGEFITEETINRITLTDVLAYYEKYFNPNNAYLVVVGDINLKTAEKQIKAHFDNWKKSAQLSYEVPQASPNVQYTQINFVDMPNAVQSNISITNTIDLKMSNPDYFASLIANYILGGGGDAYLYKNLRETHGYTYGSYSRIKADQYVGSFSAEAQVRNMVTDSSIVEILKEVNRIKTEPISAEVLKNAKAKYVGSFVMALEKPQTIARYALNIKLNNLPKDFYSTYLQKINAVTAEDVQRVANTYFKTENARIIVVGKGSEVLENLEKTGIPIMYFDPYANPVERPVFSKPIPKGVTTQSVLDNYLSAIGGKEQAKTVKTVLTTANVKIEGVPFAPTAEMKAMFPNKESIEMTIEGMGVIMKQKFNGETGYVEQQGQRQALTDEELVDKKSEYSIFPELYYDLSLVNLESMTTIDGHDVYKVKVSDSKNDSYRYYDSKTGYLLRVESTIDAQGQSMVSIVDFGNYSPVNGIQFPYSQTVNSGPQVINFNITSIKVNENVSDADFD
jgi:predicted Zn-dependent peptidase